MKRAHRWGWIALGTTGALVLIARRRRTPAGATSLGSPLEASGTPATTPHGYFGAFRDGPPVHTHQGVDLAAPPRSQVLAVGDGVIVATDPGLGKIVRKLRLDSAASFSEGAESVEAIVYADLGKPLVEPGQRVHKGDAIALVSPAGFVHFAVKAKSSRGETFIDPKRAGFAYRSSAPSEASKWNA